MELDITEFFNGATPSDYSASVIEKGPDAGPITWAAACAGPVILPDADAIEAARAFIRASGGWDDTEIAAMPDSEVNALIVQWIAGDMRDFGSDAEGWDWEEYETGSAAGTYAGNLFRGTDGRIYFYMGE